MALILNKSDIKVSSNSWYLDNPAVVNREYVNFDIIYNLIKEETYTKPQLVWIPLSAVENINRINSDYVREGRWFDIISYYQDYASSLVGSIKIRVGNLANDLFNRLELKRQENYSKLKDLYNIAGNLIPRPNSIAVWDRTTPIENASAGWVVPDPNFPSTYELTILGDSVESGTYNWSLTHRPEEARTNYRLIIRQGPPLGGGTLLSKNYNAVGVEPPIPDPITESGSFSLTASSDDLTIQLDHARFASGSLGPWHRFTLTKV